MLTTIKFLVIILHNIFLSFNIHNQYWQFDCDLTLTNAISCYRYNAIRSDGSDVKDISVSRPLKSIYDYFHTLVSGIGNL